MYYIKKDADRISIHEIDGGQFHFSINLWDSIDNYNLSGNTLSVSYSNGRVEVYDVESRHRIR